MSVSNKALQSSHCITPIKRLWNVSKSPTVAKDPDGRIAQIYKEIAKKVSAKLTQQDKALSSFPSITIE
jgi:hypothetical protein